MKKKNVRAAEIALIITVILFIILVSITYRNLAILSEGMSNIETVETTTMA